MSRYISLETEKYFNTTAESKAIKSHKNRIAVRALLAFFVGVALLPAAIYAGEHLHEWMPIADNWVREVSGGKFQIPRVQWPETVLGQLFG